MVVCDGGAGMHVALKECWPDTLVQRCLLHLQRNMRKYLTTRSKTVAGQTLWQLALKLTRIHTPERAAEWMQQLLVWEELYLYLTKQRTYRENADQVPDWVSSRQRWWYTHQRLRSAYLVLNKAIRAEHLFTYLTGQGQALRVPATTNGIEGGVNAQLRELLHRHRGMRPAHQRRTLEWWLYMHSVLPDPKQVIREHEHRKQRREQERQVALEEAEAPGLYGDALTAEEGLWMRSGWAGRG